MFSGSSPITSSSFPSEACQKQGAFPPSRFRGFSGTIPLSDSRPYQHPKCCCEPLPHFRDGSPTLHKALSRHAILITPVDQNRCTYIGFFLLSCFGLPRILGGSASTSLLSRPAQGSLALRPAGLQPPLRCTSVSRASAGRSPSPSVWIATELNR